MFPKFLLSALFAAAVALCAGGVNAAANPAPQAGSVNYDTFHSTLAAHGSWMHNARWGDVWRPGIAGFRPYFDRGHWVYTADYGWYWNADDDWGDIVFHYGRWVFDPDEGWVWIPGYVWGPGWVAWRWGDGYAGWMPEPPDSAFLTGGLDLSFGFGAWDAGFYGYQGWYGGAVGPADLWFFVGAGHLADPGLQRFVVPRAQVASFIARTRNVTRYAMRNGFVVNRSIDVHEVEHFAGHRIASVSARTLLHSRFAAMHATVGEGIAKVERTHHPFPANTVKTVRQVRRTTIVETAHRTTQHMTRTTSRRARTLATRAVSHTQHHYMARTHVRHHYATTHARTYAQHNYRSPSTAYRAPFHPSGFAHQSYHPVTHAIGGGESHGAPSHSAPAQHSSGKPQGH